MRQDDRRVNMNNPYRDKNAENKKTSIENRQVRNIGKSAVEKPKKCLTPAIITIVVMLLFIGAEFLLKTNLFKNQNPYISLVVIQFFVFILPCAFVSAISSKNSGGLSDYNFRLFPPKMLGFVFSALAVMLFGNMLLKYLGYVLFGVVNKATVIYENENMLALIAATVLVPAIAEEILMRGTVYHEYEKSGVGALGAIIGSSFMFAFIHFDPANFISYLFSGIILAISLHITKSLLAPIAIHLLNNTICIFTDTFIKRISKESISSVFVIFLLSVLLLVALFLFIESLEWICVAKAYKTSKEAKNENEYKGTRLIPQKTQLREIFSCIFINPAFYTAVIIYFLRVLIIR